MVQTSTRASARYNMKLFSTFMNVMNKIIVNKRTKSNVYELVLTLDIPDSHSHSPPFILEVAKCLRVETFIRKYIRFIK